MKRFLLSVLGLLVAAEAAAQQFGQWTWDASLSAVQREWQDARGGVDTNDRTESEMALSLGVNGHILHPTIASFRAAIGGLVSNSRASLDTRQLGYDVRLRALPLSNTPFEIFASRSSYDYSSGEGADTLPFLGTPDTSMTLGGRLRIRSGWLAGSLFGAEQSEVSYLDGDNERLERQFADWSGSSATFRHHYNAEHRLWDIGRSDYAYDDYSFAATEQGTLSPEWRWIMAATGTRRDYLFKDVLTSSTDLANITNQLSRISADGNTLSLDFTGGISRSGDGYSLSTHRVGARYQRKLGANASIGPYAGYGLQLGAEETVTIPELGIAGTWDRTGGAIEIALNGAVGLQRYEVSADSASSSADQFSYSAGLSLAYGSDTSLRQQLDASYSKNDLTLSGEAAGDFPDYGVAFFGAGFEDNAAVRLTLSKQVSDLRLSAWCDLRATRTSPVSVEPLEINDLIYSIQLTSGRIGLTASGGSTEVLDGVDQTIDFVSATGSFRPWRSLQFNALYRTDVRRMENAGNVDSSRIEAGAQFQLGLLVLGFSYFDNRFVDSDGLETVNKGMTATIRRSFGGSLPIVSAPVRKGTIR